VVAKQLLIDLITNRNHNASGNPAPMIVYRASGNHHCDISLFTRLNCFNLRLCPWLLMLAAT